MRFPWTWLAVACFPLWITKRTLLAVKRWSAPESGPGAWWHEVAPNLVVGGIPFPSRRDVDALAALGTRAVLSCCGEYLDDEGAYRRLGIELTYVPTLDDFAVSEEKLARSVEWITARVRAGTKVYLHCAAGRGRSVSVALAYLVKEHGLTTDAALARVQSVRPAARPTPWQLRSVRRFEAGLARS